MSSISTHPTPIEKLKGQFNKKKLNGEPYYFNANKFDFLNHKIILSEKSLISNELKNKTRVYINSDNARYSFIYDEMYDCREENNDNKKEVGIVYSGGWDSNYLMMIALQKGQIVRPIIFNFLNDWIIREININALMLRYPNQIKPPIIIGDGEFCTLPSGLSPHSIGQQPMIHFSLGFLHEDDFNRLSEIQIGYVMGDCACSYVKQLRQIYNSSQFIQFGKIIPLKYPLINYTKDMFLYKVTPWIKANKLISCTCEKMEISYFKAKNGLAIEIKECDIDDNEYCKCHSCSTFDYQTKGARLPYKLIKLFYNESHNVFNDCVQNSDYIKSEDCEIEEYIKTNDFVNDEYVDDSDYVEDSSIKEKLSCEIH